MTVPHLWFLKISQSPVAWFAIQIACCMICEPGGGVGSRACTNAQDTTLWWARIRAARRECLLLVRRAELTCGLEGAFHVRWLFFRRWGVSSGSTWLVAPFISQQVAEVSLPPLNVRKWLIRCWKPPSFSGSGASGMSVHDLVRDVMMQRQR